MRRPSKMRSNSRLSRRKDLKEKLIERSTERLISPKMITFDRSRPSQGSKADTSSSKLDESNPRDEG